MTAPANTAAPIRVGIVSEGTSVLKFHALRDDGTAACSSYLNVAEVRDMQADAIPPRSQCKAKACQKLFARATGATP